ncbi:acyltransferase [Aetokthonos hydrillicola Thurmond2011]|jgi:peptidoglycan/LPS O-acetylase OafA/YrhL|uniref:Acyltransferase n=1 Tax=Aetokthonos hydrillicola Thurmond2011 TaxID=2712845 RepID=A0AAP5ME94_9CYAN|nr:acyltransferase [Aetokthonos hydrillicola]MBO3461686.1 acyltransferase [Aetokthonos hydrillicola CCALA 1050]MBW4590008.1 acyltransferase [Aetokthonos hydrillicola CCALA 1050]MDR9900589.1 acyltransferase [Aetokthonos hydrillicola Thurmond2011]
MSRNASQEKSIRLQYIDRLKILMILCVVFCHLSEYWGMTYRGQVWQFFWPTLGGIGVSGFIILSGFGLTYSRLVSNTTDLQVLPFFYKRFLRILPLYYLALLTYLLIVNVIEPQNFLAHLFVVHTFFKEYSHNPGSLWFIGLIVQYYLVFPLAYKIISQKRGLFLLGATSLFLYGLAIMLDHNGFYVRDSFISFTIQFFLGMKMALDVYKRKIKRYLSSIVFILAILEIGLFFIIVNSSLFFKLPYYIYFSVLTLSEISFFFVALNFLIIIENRFRSFQQFTPILHGMSLASYSAYLFHRPILTVLTKGSAWNWIISQKLLESQRFIILSTVSIPLIFLIGYWIQITYDFVQRKVLLNYFASSHRNVQFSDNN